MVSLTANSLISHQPYSTRRRRMIEIEEDSALITHYINFYLNEHQMLVAKVQHCFENPKIPSILFVKEDKIYYLSDKTSIVHGSGIPRAATCLSESLQRWEIISKISHRSIVIFDIVIDQKYYEKLNNSSKSLNPSLVNKTYILMAPTIVQARRIPLKIQDLLTESFSSDDSQQSRKEEVLDEVSKTPPPSPLKLHLSPTPEADS